MKTIAPHGSLRRARPRDLILQNLRNGGCRRLRSSVSQPDAAKLRILGSVTCIPQRGERALARVTGASIPDEIA